MKSNISFNSFNIGILVEAGKPHLRVNDIAKACGYTNGLTAYPEYKIRKVHGINYVPFDRLKYLVERSSGKRRPVMQDLLVEVEREFIGAMPVQSSLITPALLETPFEVRAKQLQIEKEVMSQRAELLAVEMQILTHEVHKRDMQLKLLEREAELSTIRPSNVLELKVASNG